MTTRKAGLFPHAKLRGTLTRARTAAEVAKLEQEQRAALDELDRLARANAAPTARLAVLAAMGRSALLGGTFLILEAPGVGFHAVPEVSELGRSQAIGLLLRGWAHVEGPVLLEPRATLDELRAAYGGPTARSTAEAFAAIPRPPQVPRPDAEE